MIAIERLRALEKKWRDELPYKGSAWEERHDIIEECADELATLIAELGQEVGAVGDSRRPSDAALAVAFWDARKTINESPDWVTPVEVIHWGDEIVRRAREYGTRTSPAHTSEARDSERLDWLDKATTRGSVEMTFSHSEVRRLRGLGNVRQCCDAAMRQEGGTP